MPPSALKLRLEENLFRYYKFRFKNYLKITPKGSFGKNCKNLKIRLVNLKTEAYKIIRLRQHYWLLPARQLRFFLLLRQPDRECIRIFLGNGQRQA